MSDTRNFRVSAHTDARTLARRLNVGRVCIINTPCLVVVDFIVLVVVVLVVVVVVVGRGLRGVPTQERLVSHKVPIV